MNTQELFDEINKKATELNQQWKENKLSSKKIRKQIEFEVFYNKNANFVAKCANFYALDNRIKERYNSIFKRPLRYFSWKKETQLFSKIKQFIKCPDNFDTKSIIAQKIESFVGGENCFDSNNVDKKNGTQLKHNRHNKTPNKNLKQNVVVNKEEKQIDIDKLSKMSKEAKNLEIDRVKREIGVEGIQFESTNSDKSVVDKVIYNEYLDSLPNEKMPSNALQTNQSMDTRERIEIPQYELLNFGKHFEKQNNKNDVQKIAKNDTKIVKNVAPEQNKYSKSQMDNYIPTKSSETMKIDNARIDIDKKLEKNINYDNLNDRIQKTSSSNKPSTLEKTTNENLNNYNKRLQNAINSNNKGYEQQKREIAGEEIAKMSEKDLQSIKNYMQEELNKQMKIAEEKGEIYKMPLSIKEVIDSKPAEKSEVQTNVSHNPVLKSNK